MRGAWGTPTGSVDDGAVRWGPGGAVADDAAMMSASVEGLPQAVIALYDFSGRTAAELSFFVGDLVEIDTMGRRLGDWNSWVCPLIADGWGMTGGRRSGLHVHWPGFPPPACSTRQKVGRFPLCRTVGRIAIGWNRAATKALSG